MIDKMNDIGSPVPDDIVELIIAVDLDPTDPAEPINVSSVDVRDKSDKGSGEDWKGLLMQLLMGDPSSGVTSDSISYDEAVEAVSRALGDDDGAVDPFAKIKAPRRPQDKPDGHPGGKSSMKAALKRALGGPDEDEDEDEE